MTTTLTEGDPKVGRYHFRYIPNKSREYPNPDPLDLLLLADFTPLIDALILQDHDPAYLDVLRETALKTQRPLYVRADGKQCPYGWYSRTWTAIVGTGGHIARTLIYDEFAGGSAHTAEGEKAGPDLSGEAGLAYGKLVTHHKTDKITAKYRSDTSTRKNVQTAQEIMRARALRKMTV